MSSSEKRVKEVGLAEDNELRVMSLRKDRHDGFGNWPFILVDSTIFHLNDLMLNDQPPNNK